MTKAVYPPAMDEQPLNAGILDLATHKTCGTPSHDDVRWALTPPFHPCPEGCWRRRNGSPVYYRAVFFCHVVSAVARGFPLGSMVLFVARTFLMRIHKVKSARDGPPG